jgi:nitrate reductase NapAB chaperone NapD
MSNSLQTERPNLLRNFSDVTAVPEDAIRYSENEQNGKVVIVMQGTSTTKNGDECITHLTIEQQQEKTKWKLTGRIEAPNRRTNFEKYVQCQPSSLGVFIRSCLTASRVCAKNPKLIGRIGKKVGSYF